MSDIRMKELCGSRSAKRVGFEDIETGMVWVSDYRTIYNYFHNQVVVSISRMSGNEMDILFKGYVKENLK